MSRRTVLLLSALLIAALGTFLIWLYAKGANDRALEGTNPVQVLVATQTISAGTTGAAAQSAGAFELKTLPKDAVAQGAINSVAPIEQLVALSPVFAGQQILAQQWGPPASGASSAIPEGKMAISITLGDPQRVAAFLVPGSQVAVFLSTTQPQGQLQAGSPVTRVLLTKIPVIATGSVTTVTQTTTSANGTQTQTQLPVALLTLGVTQTEAEKIIQGQSQGTLSFGLLTDKTVPVTPDTGTTPQNLFS